MNNSIVITIVALSFACPSLFCFIVYLLHWRDCFHESDPILMSLSLSPLPVPLPLTQASVTSIRTIRRTRPILAICFVTNEDDENNEIANDNLPIASLV